MTRLVPLWVGARGVEFDWKYIQMSFDANVSLVSNQFTSAQDKFFQAFQVLFWPVICYLMSTLWINNFTHGLNFISLCFGYFNV